MSGDQWVLRSELLRWAREYLHIKTALAVAETPEAHEGGPMVWFGGWSLPGLAAQRAAFAIFENAVTKLPARVPLPAAWSALGATLSSLESLAKTSNHGGADWHYAAGQLRFVARHIKIVGQQA